MNISFYTEIQSICRWHFIGDSIVLQERGIDEYGNIIFVYTPVKVNSNEWTGSYVDARGMPVFHNTDSTGCDIGLANYVHVYRDEYGFENMISFNDRYGALAPNGDGAFMGMYCWWNHLMLMEIQ